MPSKLHEALVEMLRSKPELVLLLLQATAAQRVPRPATAVTVSEGVGSLIPDYRPDCIVLLRNVHGRPSRVLVVELQLQADADKTYALPVYQALARARYGLPCEVVVITPSRHVATHLRHPIPLGGGSTFSAVVIGPEELRRTERIKCAELGFLRALAYGNREPEVVLEVARELDALPERRAALYFDLILSTLSKATRRAVEGLMQTSDYQFKSAFMRKLVRDGQKIGLELGLAKGRAKGHKQGRAEGRAEGLRRAIRSVIEARGIPLPPDLSRELEACSDARVLESWLRRAAVEATARDIFTRSRSKRSASKRASAKRASPKPGTGGRRSS